MDIEDGWSITKKADDHIEKMHEKAKPLHKIGDITVEQVISAVDEVMINRIP